MQDVNFTRIRHCKLSSIIIENSRWALAGHRFGFGGQSAAALASSLGSQFDQEHGGHCAARHLRRARPQMNVKMIRSRGRGSIVRNALRQAGSARRISQVRRLLWRRAILRGPSPSVGVDRSPSPGMRRWMADAQSRAIFDDRLDRLVNIDLGQRGIEHCPQEVAARASNPGRSIRRRFAGHLFKSAISFCCSLADFRCCGSHPLCRSHR